MNMQILASLLVIGVASAGMGYGTYAYFSSTQDVADNLFTAGTVVLSAGDGTTTPFLVATNLIPGGDSVTGAITLKNTGSIGGDQVKLDLRAVNLRVVDSTGTAVTGAGADYASKLTVTSLKYGASELLTAPVTLATLMDDVYTVSDPGAAGTALSMTVKLDSSAGNEYQGLTAKVDFDFLLRQTAAPVLGSTAS